jgi:hypothetical protein
MACSNLGNGKGHDPLDHSVSVGIIAYPALDDQPQATRERPGEIVSASLSPSTMRLTIASRSDCTTSFDTGVRQFTASPSAILPGGVGCRTSDKCGLKHSDEIFRVLYMLHASGAGQEMCLYRRNMRLAEPIKEILVKNLYGGVGHHPISTTEQTLFS